MTRTSAESDLARGPSADPFGHAGASSPDLMTPTFRSPQEHDHSNADWDAAIDDAREEKAQLRAHTTRRSSSGTPAPAPHRSPNLAPSSHFPAPPRDVHRRRRGRPRRPSSWTTSRPTRIPTRYRSNTSRSRQRRQHCTFTCMSPVPPGSAAHSLACTLCTSAPRASAQASLALSSLYLRCFR